MAVNNSNMPEGILVKTLKKTITLSTFVVMIVALSSAAVAQEKREIELTAQEILARVDRVLDYPRGMIKGRMMHIMPDGNSTLINLKAYVTENDYLFIYSSRERGDQIKVLYNLKGEDIWVYNIHAVKLFHKMSIDKYDSLLATNYSYLDLSNADYQSNYTASITGNVVVKGRDCYRLKLVPIFKGGLYGQLTLYASKKDFIPLRIDFHDTDRAIFKSFSIARTMERNNRIIPVRCDMLDIRKGTVTILEFFGFDETMVFQKELFFPQQLGNQ